MNAVALSGCNQFWLVAATAIRKRVHQTFIVGCLNGGGWCCWQLIATFTHDWVELQASSGCRLLALNIINIFGFVLIWFADFWKKNSFYDRKLNKKLSFKLKLVCELENASKWHKTKTNKLDGNNRAKALCQKPKFTWSDLMPTTLDLLYQAVHVYKWAVKPLKAIQALLGCEFIYKNDKI